MLALLERTGSERLVLTTSGAISWYLDGSRVHVKLNADHGVVACVVSRDRDLVVTTGNEVERLLAEELPGDVEVEVREWWQPLLDPASSHGAPGVLHESEARSQAVLRAARASLLPGERDRYRRLGQDAAGCVTEVAQQLTARTTEREVASLLARGLVARGSDPVVLLVAGERRLAYRHALPTDAALGRLAMLVVCARRDGLIANLTRWVSFGPRDPEVQERFAGIREVEEAFLDATRPGRTVGQVFTEGIGAYAPCGFSAREWTRHHQGGPTGYFGRDPVATSSVEDPVVVHQAFAWNPSAPGAKVEDTVLLTPGGIERLTVDDGWPTVASASGRRHPDVMSC